MRPISRFNLLSLRGKVGTLHLTWFAFFLSFLVWFNHAPLMATVRDSLNLSDQEVATLLMLNVALTIPARIVIGMLVDRFGPRLMFSLILAISSFLCFAYAMADSFETLALTRFLLGFVGAGFVIGIRMIGEWFPAREVGLAQGIYGGWGNFGSAAAAMTLPTLALIYGGENGWRYAVATTGAIALVYSIIYYLFARNTPKGSTYFRPDQAGSMEVTSVPDFFLYLLMKIPLVATLALLVWKLGPGNLELLSVAVCNAFYLICIAVYLYQAWHILRINGHVFRKTVPEIHRYEFKQVAVLNLAYLVTFGSELAVISMLPLFFKDTFELSTVTAGLLASGFAFMNLVARPGGGLISDRIGRKFALLVLLTAVSAGYVIMSQITSAWPIALAVVSIMSCSFFVQAGSGAVFAMAPLIKRRMTGQVAGMVGAYGNVGAVLFLTVLSFASPKLFFMVIAATAIVVVFAVALFLKEPRGATAEFLPDGTVQMIEVE
jgi:NNP family nitrate/nitrite transporter-like MFS transporter